MLIPSWVWQVVGAAGGLGIGLVLGALWLRRGDPSKRARTAREAGPSAERSAARPRRQAAGGGADSEGRPSELHASQFPARADSAQQRLLERLRETNLDLSAQLRASAAQHSRLLKDKDDEFSALKDDYDRRVEELRQSHSAELRHLMTLLVDQVDGIHKTHAHHVKALEAELDRLRRESRLEAAPSGAPGADTTTFAHTEMLSGVDVRH